MSGGEKGAALVTGATSMVGRALLARLLASGREVIATARSRHAVEEVTAAGARPLYTDLENLDRWRGEAERAAVVYHLATPRITPPVHAPRTHRNARLARRGTEAVSRLAAGRPIVLLSSALVLGDRAEPIPDDAPPAPLALARAHRAAEEALAEDEARVLRTGWVYGPGGLMSFVVPALRARRHRIVGRGDNLWPLISAADAASALLRLEDAPPGSYQASEHGERPPTQSEVVDALCAGSLRKPDRAPRWLAKATLGGPLAGALGSSQWIPSARLRALGWAPERVWTHELPALTA